MELTGFEGGELVEDVSPAQWLHESLWEPWSGNGFRVGSLVPPVFDAHARIFHPAFNYRGDEAVTWSEVARAHGRTAHALMQWTRVAPGTADEGRWVHPSVGELEELPTRALASVLQDFTSTPHTCWFCIWAGFGHWWGPGGQFLRMGPQGTDIEQLDQTPPDPKLSDRDEMLERWPKVLMPLGRDYFLFRGEVMAAATLAIDGYPLSANLWWPEDRVWCVATEIDYDSTVVGGTRECIEAVLESNDLEALPVVVDDRLDLEGDELNPPSPKEENRD